MKRKVFDCPDNEPVIVLRSSIRDICNGNRPAFMLLTILLFYSENNESLHDETLQTYTCRKTDAQICGDLLDEITSKTLRDVAVPVLQMLGYVSIPQKDVYVLHLDAINRALSQGKGDIVNPSYWSKLQEDKIQRIVQRNLHRARKKHLPATLTVDQWRATIKHFNGKCAYCLERDYQVLEHVVPLSKQNSAGTVLSNCVPACYPCNTNDRKYHQPGFAGVISYLESVAYLKSAKGE